MVRRGADIATARRQRDDARDFIRSRRAFGTHGAAQGRGESGFVFYTNYDSAKGAISPRTRASLLFFWRELERQVRISGSVTKTTHAESGRYFHSRPIESQIARRFRAEPAGGRSIGLDSATRSSRTKGSVVPLPASWGGYRVTPDAIEFWQGRKSRLHDRLLYTRQVDGSWARSRLAP